MKRPENRTFPHPGKPRACAACELSTRKPRRKSEFPRRKNGLPRTPERAISARQSPIIRPKKRRRISGKFSPAGAHKFKMPRRKKNSRRPNRAQSLNRGVRAAADNLRNRLYRRPPTAQEYAFGLFPRRRRLSWRTGGWRNILRRARRAPWKRGRPFAG